MASHFSPVNKDGGQVVDAFKDQKGPGCRRQRIEIKGAPVPPIDIFDPEAILIVFAKERIGDAVKGQQIGADIAGDSGRQPFSDSVEVEYIEGRERATRRLSKAPLVIIEAYDGSGHRQETPNLYLCFN